MNDIARRIEEMMRENGYTLVRNGSSHKVWSDGKNKITTSVTPRCPRAFLNARALVRRLKRST